MTEKARMPADKEEKSEGEQKKREKLKGLIEKASSEEGKPVQSFISQIPEQVYDDKNNVEDRDISTSQIPVRVEETKGEGIKEQEGKEKGIKKPEPSDSQVGKRVEVPVMIDSLKNVLEEKVPGDLTDKRNLFAENETVEKGLKKKEVEKIKEGDKNPLL